MTFWWDGPYKRGTTVVCISEYLTYVFNQTDTNYDDTFSPSLIDHSCLPNAVVTFSGKLLCVRALEKIENPSPDNVSKII